MWPQEVALVVKTPAVRATRWAWAVVLVHQDFQTRCRPAHTRNDWPVPTAMIPGFSHSYFPAGRFEDRGDAEVVALPGSTSLAFFQSLYMTSARDRDARPDKAIVMFTPVAGCCRIRRHVKRGAWPSLRTVWPVGCRVQHPLPGQAGLAGGTFLNGTIPIRRNGPGVPLRR